MEILIMFGFMFVERYEGIDEILNQYSTRTFTFNGLNKTAAERIIKLRPVSPHYAIFARPSEMTSLLENVRHYDIYI